MRELSQLCFGKSLAAMCKKSYWAPKGTDGKKNVPCSAMQFVAEQGSAAKVSSFQLNRVIILRRQS